MHAFNSASTKDLVQWRLYATRLMNLHKIPVAPTKRGNLAIFCRNTVIAARWRLPKYRDFGKMAAAKNA